MHVHAAHKRVITQLDFAQVALKYHMLLRPQCIVLSSMACMVGRRARQGTTRVHVDLQELDVVKQVHAARGH